MISITLSSGHALSSQGSKRTPKSHNTIQTTQSGLKAFVKFTGQQLIIINNDAFDWMNVQFVVRAWPVPERASAESLAGSEITYRLPRVKARGVYTINTFQLGKSTSAAENDPTTRSFSLEIRCDTPQGQDSWVGRWE